MIQSSSKLSGGNFESLLTFSSKSYFCHNLHGSATCGPRATCCRRSNCYPVRRLTERLCIIRPAHLGAANIFEIVALRMCFKLMICCSHINWQMRVVYYNIKTNFKTHNSIMNISYAIKNVKLKKVHQTN